MDSLITWYYWKAKITLLKEEVHAQFLWRDIEKFVVRSICAITTSPSYLEHLEQIHLNNLLDNFIGLNMLRSLLTFFEVG